MGSLALHSYQPRFIEIVSAVLRKLKMYENASGAPPPHFKKKENKNHTTCIPS
jgi:hypothetical protein